ncbi:MAG: flagellar motor protein MotB [Bryobacteraceae bacterium]|jgi:chemotaxis protein MotB
MRRHYAIPRENHDRWLVSYADFITLLFAFFVVMFASTQADKSKAREVSQAVRDALQHGQISSAISMFLGRGKYVADKPPVEPSLESPRETYSPAPAHPADLVQSMATLQQGLDLDLKSGKVQLSLEPRGLVISLREAAFFASGDDAVAPNSAPILAKIAAVIQGVSNPLRLEGYTDSVPIHNSRFHSNWELSAARSIAMLEMLRQRFQIAPSRLSVAGYAENAPADDNGTEEGRAHNRRVDLVLLSAEALKVEPQAAPQ